MNKYIGIGGLSAGLVLQEKPEIDTDQAGLKQTTLRFATFHKNNPALEPVRGTRVSDFVGGDALTNATLNTLPYLGAQSCKWILDGEAPGIDILEVLCQGAVFVTADGDMAQWTQEASGVGAVTRFYPIVTETQQDLSFSIYDSPLVGGSTANLSARLATTGPLGATYDGGNGGELFGAFNGGLSVDGSADPAHPSISPSGISPLGNGQKVLVKDQPDARQNGLYVVWNAGGATWPFHLVRDSGLNQNAQFLSTVQISVTDGSTNKATIWQLVPGGGGSFIVGNSPVTFTNLAPAGTAMVTPLYNVHIVYHSIDLSFEYVSRTRLQQARYILPEYTLNGDGTITIADALFSFPAIYQVLKIDKVEAQALKSATPTAWAYLDPSIWQSHVHFPGTGAQFVQTPVGFDMHILETNSIKIEAILPPVGSVA